MGLFYEAIEVETKFSDEKYHCCEFIAMNKSSGRCVPSFHSCFLWRNPDVETVRDRQVVDLVDGNIDRTTGN